MAKDKTEFKSSSYVPEIYADAGTGTFTPNGNMRITLESWRVDHSTSSGSLQRVVIGRLVMLLDQAEMLAESILDVVKNRISEDKKPSRAEKKPTTKSSDTLQ